MHRAGADFARWVAIGCMGLACACVDGTGGDADSGAQPTEVISRVELVFSPRGGGDELIATFDDPDGEGGLSGESEPIALTLGETYDLEVRLLNALEDPIVDIGQEVGQEAEEHQIFIYGDAVAGPASVSGTAVITHAYADHESDYGPNDIGEDLVLGLAHVVEADRAGTGTLRVMLRHLPERNGSAQKNSGLAADLAAGESLPGDVDADLRFDLSVQ